MILQNKITSKERVIEWLSEIDYSMMYAVTLTMKQQVGSQSLDEFQASKNLRYFLNIMNHQCFGNSVKRYGKQLRVIPFLEKSSWQRFHYHITLEKPNRLSEEDFKDLVSVCWAKTTFGHKEIDIQKMYSNRWISYCAKSFNPADSLDIENLYIGC